MDSERSLRLYTYLRRLSFYFLSVFLKLKTMTPLVGVKSSGRVKTMFKKCFFKKYIDQASLKCNRKLAMKETHVFARLS